MENRIKNTSGPNLWDDWRIGDNWTVDRLGSITKGSCKSKFIMACDAHLSTSDGRNAEIVCVFIDFIRVIMKRMYCNQQKIPTSYQPDPINQLAWPPSALITAKRF
ncbi:MAG: hypothetical protein IPP67_04155 [Rhodospirillaceae bacterium]|nr:hypothetical protein [Rhodospirillaceae bacterium]